MRKLTLLAMTGLLIGSAVGCARPMEIGYSPAHTTGERIAMTARAWDIEGKQLVEDLDHALLLRPPSRLSPWNLR
jgi:hypothetical protein